MLLSPSCYRLKELTSKTLEPAAETCFKKADANEIVMILGLKCTINIHKQK